MKLTYQLFNFYGIPVNFNLMFLILLFFIEPITVVCLFISILIHELAHAFIALQKNYFVSEVKIDVLYGFASMDISNIPERDSWKIALAGPISNLILSVIAVLIGSFYDFEFLSQLFVINILLFMFNILPIYPMDGGRILRDILFMKMSSRKLAKKISSIVSLIFSSLLLIWYIIDFSLIGLVFSSLFIYYSLKELEWL
jgi:Zn-dependent protease